MGRDQRTLSSFETVPVTSPLAGRSLVPVNESQPVDQNSTFEAYRGKLVQKSIKEKTQASRRGNHLNTVTHFKRKADPTFLLPTIKGNIMTRQQYIRVLDKKPVRKITSARAATQVNAPERVDKSHELCPLLQIVKTLIPDIEIKTKQLSARSTRKEQEC